MKLCVVRGGGDLATGVVWRLRRAGFAVLVTELAHPLTVRRTVAVSSAVFEGTVEVEGMVARRVASVADGVACAAGGEVAVLVSPELPPVAAAAVVDARLAKRNIDTTRDDADIVVGLGPGFVAGVDCHAVVETNRGARLGRVLWRGAAQANTGTPGVVGGHGAERVLRAETAGTMAWSVGIGEPVDADQLLGTLGTDELRAPFDGVVRGLIHPAVSVVAGLKVGDIDPRATVAVHEISDKALAIGGGVVDAVLGSLEEDGPLSPRFT